MMAFKRSNRDTRHGARIVRDEPSCDCDESHRVDVHLESTDGLPAIANLCTRCGRIHRLPANARIRAQHDEDHDTVPTLNRVLSANDANAIRLQDELLTLYQQIEDERATIERRVEAFRRRYPQPPVTESAHYRAALSQYQADIERLRELEMAEAHANEALGMLGMQEDPDPDQFERIRALAGMPSLSISLMREQSETTDTEQEANESETESSADTEQEAQDTHGAEVIPDPSESGTPPSPAQEPSDSDSHSSTR
jgi:hypothetical protein